MIESLYQQLPHFPPALVLAVLLVVPFIENIFPPFPADVIVVFIGTLIADGLIYPGVAIIVASFGSELGFLFLFYLGAQTDKKIIKMGKLKFISPETLQTAEDWFERYGYGILLMNRFLPGVRSVIAYFAGVSQLSLQRTVILSSISAAAWHSLLLLLGVFLGHKSRIETIDHFLNMYGMVIMIVLCAAGAFFFLRYYLRKKRKKETG